MRRTKVNRCLGIVALLVAILGVIVVSAVFAGRAHSQYWGGPPPGAAMTFGGRGWSMTIFVPPPRGCGGPVFLGSPPMYGGGYGFDPYFQPPGQVNRRAYGYGQPPQGYYNREGLGLVYDEAYQRRVRQLEQDRRYQLEQMARERARRDAERQFYGRGW